MAIEQSVRTKILRALVELYKHDEDLFDLFGGAIGTGTIDAPDIPPRIYAYPMDLPTQDLQHLTLLVLPVHGSGNVYEPQVSAVDTPTYVYGVFLVMSTLRAETTFAELTVEDYLEAIRRTTLRGDNARVPGKLVDPDDPTAELNTLLPQITEIAPVRSADNLTTYRQLISYETKLDLRTGENR